MPKPPQIRKWLGLRNTVRPERQPWGALATADNVLLDDSSALELRPGFARSLAIAGITDAYAPISRHYALVLAAGSLYSIDDSLGSRLLGSGYTESSFHWAQTENRVLFAGDTEAGLVIGGQILLPLRFPQADVPTVATLAGSMPAGQYQFAVVYRYTANAMEGTPSMLYILEASTPCAFKITSAPPAGYEADVYVTAADDTTLRYLGTGSTVFYNLDPAQLGEALDADQLNAYPLPQGIAAIEIHEACLFAAVWDQATNTSAVWRSRPWAYHWYTLDQDGLAIPGKVLALLSTSAGLLIGSDTGIRLMTPDEGLVSLTDYGVVPGRPMIQDAEHRVTIWTTHGLATFSAAKGFVDRFEGKLSVAGGSSCASAIVEFGGSRYALVLTDSSGTPENAYA